MEKAFKELILALRSIGDALMGKMSFWIVSLDSCEFICNHCLKNSKTASNYCPNCGAKMDGGLSGNNI